MIQSDGRSSRRLWASAIFLRVTPLIRVAHRLGYEVDVLLATDYPEAAKLLEGAPEIQPRFPSAQRAVPRWRRHSRGPNGYRIRRCRLHHLERAVAQPSTRPPCAGFRSRAMAKGRRQPECGAASRASLGWKGEMPEPFAIASTRSFDLPPGTVAIHPGCKVEWPWKKWHGFDELARKFPNVVIVGSDEDLRTEGTYFRRDLCLAGARAKFHRQTQSARYGRVASRLRGACLKRFRANAARGCARACRLLGFSASPARPGSRCARNISMQSPRVCPAKPPATPASGAGAIATAILNASRLSPRRKCL